MIDEEREFDLALSNWQEIVKRRPESGIFSGEYVDEKKHTYFDDHGNRREIHAPVPHEQLAEDYKAWKVYVYAREKLLNYYGRMAKN